jgi:Zn-dependent metalloprotease
LVIVKDILKTDSIYRLAYKFDIYAHKPLSRNYIWIDAITGEVINIESRIHFSNATGTAATRYSGTRTIMTDSYNGSYRLRESRNGVNISTFNMNHGITFGNAIDFTDSNNNWTAAEFHNANKDDAALDVHWGTEMTYDYFKNMHNRNSWNGNGGALLSYVNYGSGYENASWDGQRMKYGDGSTDAYVCLDIVAHEIGHAVCDATANLVYSGESGAINESLSDIWGACVENWATTGKQTWLCGEDLVSAARSLSNPNTYWQSDTYGGTYWFAQNGCIPNGNNDWCGVHTNSGVGNFWFYLLSQGGSGTNDWYNTYNITGIGIEKAAKIVYKAETSYLTSSANYAQFRNATISAATYYSGENSNEVIAVTNAWHAVGVKPPPVISGPSQVCSSGATFIVSNDYNEPAGVVVWTCSSNLQLVYYNCSYATFKSTGNGPAWVRATVNGIQTEQFNTYAIKSDISVSWGQYMNGTYRASISVPSGLNVWEYNWNVGNGWIFSQYPGNNGGYSPYKAVIITPPSLPASLPHSVTAYVLSSYCLSSYTFNITGNSSSMTAYASPNPVSDILNIEFAAVETVLQTPEEASAEPVEIQSDQSAVPVKTRVLHTETSATNAKILQKREAKLYNQSGSQVRSMTFTGDKTQLNVSDLPAGIYYLHIYDGVNEKPEIRQIIVQH